MLLAEAVNDTREGPLRDFHTTEKDRYELKIAGLLHDCGKITTPVHVVDKATKLQTLYDRIDLVDTRFEVLKRDAEIEALHKKLDLRTARDPKAAAAIGSWRGCSTTLPWKPSRRAQSDETAQPSSSSSLMYGPSIGFSLPAARAAMTIAERA